MMIIIVCVDDNNGMLFHNRRQSRDTFVQTHYRSNRRKKAVNE